MTERSTKVKQLGLLVTAGLLLIFSLYFLSVPFSNGEGFLYWLGVAVLLLVTLNAMVFSSLFSFSKASWWLASVIASLSILLFFPWHWLQILTVLVVIAGVVQLSRNVQNSEKKFIDFSYYRTAKPGMRILLISLIFLASINVYITTSNTLQENPDRFYQNISRLLVRSAEPFLTQNIEGFTPQTSVDEFLQQEDYFYPEEQSSNNGQNLEELREEVLSVFGVQASGDEQVVNVLRRVVEVRVKDLFEPIQQYIPVVYALLLFLSLRFVVPIIVWIAAGLGSLLFRLLVKIGLITMNTKQVEVEVPELAG